MIKLLVTAGTLAMVVAAVVLRSSPDSGRVASGAAKTSRPALPILQGTEPQADPPAPGLIAALPTRTWEIPFSERAFRAVERALYRDPAAVLPMLLERYSHEADPLLKGLLAVLLSMEPSTRAGILKDYRAAVPGGDDLFRGLALYGLATGRRAGKVICDPFWANLIRFAGWAPKSVRVEVAARSGEQSDELRQLYNEVHGIRNYTPDVIAICSPDFDKDALRGIRGADDPEIRLALLEAHDRIGQWSWIQDVAYAGLRQSTRNDVEFAGAVLQRYTELRDRERVLVGLGILSESEIPTGSIGTLETIARSSIEDLRQFESAVWLMGRQKGAEPASILMDLYTAVAFRHELFAELLGAMRQHESPDFEPAGTAGLTSTSPRVREKSLELLSTVAAGSSIEPLVRAVISDPDAEVRETALLLMVEANRWTPVEEDALIRVAQADPHRPLRNIATRLLSAKDRTSDDAWDDSDPEPEDPMD